MTAPITYASSVSTARAAQIKKFRTRASLAGNTALVKLYDQHLKDLAKERA